MYVISFETSAENRNESRYFKQEGVYYMEFDAFKIIRT